MSDLPTLTLRGQRSDDLEVLYTLLNHAEVMRDSVDLPYAAEDVFRERYGGLAARAHTLIAESSLPSGRNRFVGAAWITVMRQRRRHTGDLRVVIHPEYRDTAIESNVVQAALDLAERWIGLERIETRLYTDSDAALALYEAHGFVREATLRHYAFRDGAQADAVLMARLHIPDYVATPQPPPAVSGTRPSSRRGSGLHAPIMIRGIESDDWEDASDIRAGDSVIANTLQIPYVSRDRTRDYLENLPDDRHMLAAVVDDRVVGMLGLHLNTGRRAHAASLGMQVHADFQGRGVGSALMDAAINLAENWLNISRLELEVFVDNVAGLALYRKFGFEIEGLMRAYAFRNGHFADTYTMARVRGQRDGLR